MPNRIFAVAYERQEFSGFQFSHHVFGGVTTRDTQNVVFEAGLDFAGRAGIDTRGRIGNRDALKVILVPVTEASAKRFISLVGIFRALDNAGQFPVYFSRLNQVNSFFEGEGAHTISLSGKEELINGIIINNASLVRPNGYMVSCSENPRPGKVWVRGNCVTLFNFAADISGIRFDLLSPGWFEMYRGKMFLDTYDQLSAKTSAAAQDKPNMIQTRVLACANASAVLIESGLQRPLSELIMKGLAPIGGVETLASDFDKADPLSSDPKPLPEYLQIELGNLGQNVPV